MSLHRSFVLSIIVAASQLPPHAHAMPGIKVPFQQTVEQSSVSNLAILPPTIEPSVAVAGSLACNQEVYEFDDTSSEGGSYADQDISTDDGDSAGGDEAVAPRNNAFLVCAQAPRVEIDTEFWVPPLDHPAPPAPGARNPEIINPTPNLRDAGGRVGFFPIQYTVAGFGCTPGPLTARFVSLRDLPIEIRREIKFDLGVRCAERYGAGFTRVDIAANVAYRVRGLAGGPPQTTEWTWCMSVDWSPVTIQVKYLTFEAIARCEGPGNARPERLDDEAPFPAAWTRYDLMSPESMPFD